MKFRLYEQRNSSYPIGVHGHCVDEDKRLWRIIKKYMERGGPLSPKQLTIMYWKASPHTRNVGEWRKVHPDHIKRGMETWVKRASEARELDSLVKRLNTPAPES